MELPLAQLLNKNSMNYMDMNTKNILKETEVNLQKLFDPKLFVDLVLQYLNDESS